MSATDEKVYSCKIVNTHPKNPRRFKIPSVVATGMLFDSHTGYPIMVIESTLLTTLRTATSSAIATKYLARPNNKIIGIIGNGAEALPHLHAISLVRSINNVCIYDIDKDASQSFKGSAKKLLPGIDIFICENAREVSRRSDILVTLTTKERNSSPLVLTEWIRHGTHINAVGGDSSKQIELEKSLLEKSKLVVDFRDDALLEGESHQVGEKKIYADLSQLVAKLKKGRSNDQEITVFDSVGFGMLDLQTYKLVYNIAKKLGLGKKANVAGNPRDCKNLYSSYFMY
jgi:ornithine cyclodeaminase/alanine dehydrogenase